MATQKQILAAARRRWGRQIYLRHNPRAPTPARREELRAQLRELRSEEKLCRVAWKQVETSWRKLIAAAQFVLDTDCATSALEELRQASTEAAELASRLDTGRSLAEEIRRIGHLPNLDRYTVCDTSSGIFALVVATGDTLDEVLEKIRQVPSPSAG